MPTSRVSILIPAFNAERFVGAAISSALAQTHADVEVVVIDDGSTDRTPAIVDGYGDRVVWTRQENKGLSGARNAALELATGDVVALCDADDILLPNHVASLLTLMHEAGPRSWASGNAQSFGPNGLAGSVLPHGVIAPGDQRRAILQANFVPIFAMFRREMLDEVGVFSTDLTSCEDWHLWSRAIFSGWRVATTQTPTALYRRHAGSLSTQTENMARNERRAFELLLASHGAAMTTEEREHVERRLTRGSARDLMREADAALAAADWQKVADLTKAAAADYPLDRRLGMRARLLAASPQSARLIARWRARQAS